PGKHSWPDRGQWSQSFAWNGSVTVGVSPNDHAMTSWCRMRRGRSTSSLNVLASHTLYPSTRRLPPDAYRLSPYRALILPRAAADTVVPRWSRRPVHRGPRWGILLRPSSSKRALSYARRWYR